MQSVANYYRLINILSLDVAFGATISAFFLAQVFNVAPTSQIFLCLSLTVWVIYTADHLVDAKLIENKASTLRHQFHQRHFKIILLLTLMVLSIIIPLLFFISEPVLNWGMGLVVLVIIYFIIQRRLGFLKEVLGALLYCFGVMLPVIALSEISLYVLLSVPSILFFNTVLINLILFSWFDGENDLADNHSSLVTHLGKSAVRRLLYLLFLVQFLLMAFAYTKMEILALIVFALMYFVLLSIFFYAKWFASDDKYRIAGDAIFLIPLIYPLL